jgi:hypothetical protein
MIGVGQIVPNERRAAMRDVSSGKRRELRASFDLNRQGCFG